MKYSSLACESWLQLHEGYTMLTRHYAPFDYKPPPSLQTTQVRVQQTAFTSQNVNSQNVNFQKLF